MWVARSSVPRGSASPSTRSRAAGIQRLTWAFPVVDDQNTLTIGERGPQLLDDFVMREKIFHFDHERIPERVVHVRGFGVKGYFENYESLSDITMADPFQRAGDRTDLFVRFSNVAGNKGSMDLARDVRGFAVKFYTRQGNWDLVGNNMPVFFIQDAMKFPDLVHAVKEAPDRGFPQAQSAHDNFRIEPAREAIDLDPSPALRILLNGPESFTGRRLGVLVTNGADAKTLAMLQTAVKKAGAQIPASARTPTCSSRRPDSTINAATRDTCPSARHRRRPPHSSTPSEHSATGTEASRPDPDTRSPSRSNRDPSIGYSFLGGRNR